MDAPGKALALAVMKTTPAGKAEKPTTLLDMQEVEWITRELERLLAREQSGGGDAGADGRRRRNRANVSPAPKNGGFLTELLGRHAVAICSGDAVDSSAAAGVDRSRRRGGRGSCGEMEKV
uniref:Uncharacterized protein n=1 Tax=Arundo donax TaxID=35708 RepID=A0A0A9AZH8_ARUDO